MKSKIYLLLVLAICCTKINAQDPIGKFIEDPLSKCKIWNPYPVPDDSVSWKGDCINGFAEGHGTLTWFSNGTEVSRFEGELKHGNPNGKGKYTFENGEMLEGNFLEGEYIKLKDKYFLHLKKNYMVDEDASEFYLNDAGSKKLFYLSLIPEKDIKGVLILFSSAYETAEGVINYSGIPEIIYDNGIATLIPSINNTLYLNEEILSVINKIILDAIEKYDIPKDKIIMGGFSAGGNLALRYTEKAYEDSLLTSVIPRAVFGIDPPVDLSGLYSRFQRKIKRKNSDASVNEAITIKNKMDSIFGGSPEQKLEKYISASPYSLNEETTGNIKYLKNVPVRIYCEPDIEWYLNNRQSDYYDLNALDLSSMINELIILGNANVEFITTSGKGFRPDGKRHPHSWTIVDPGDLNNWMLENFK